MNMGGLEKKEALEILQSAFGVDPDDTLKEFKTKYHKWLLQGNHPDTGAESDKTLTVCGIDVLFTDIALPGGVNGAELAEEVHRRHPDVHIICTTGYAKDDVLRNRPLLAGTPLITKPYSRSTLAQEFAAVLSRQRSD